MIKRLALVSAALLLSTAWANNTKLLRAVEQDPSYKVRMQALRVLSKRYSKKKVPDEVLKVVQNAAAGDEEHLVRGMACVALGTLLDPRGLPVLERALQDSSAFVRAQAKRAINKIKSAKGPSASLVGSGRPILVIEVDPGAQAPEALQAALKSLMETRVKTETGGRFALEQRKGSAGFRLGGQIARLDVLEQGEGKKITIEVKISIATWPQKNLRGVISAQASARAGKRSSASQLLRLQRKLLAAAVERAIKDSIAQIDGG